MIKLTENISLNFLADALFKELQNKDDFFSPTYVVCPNHSLEQWLKTYWLKNKEEVLMNITFLTFSDALKMFLIPDKHYQLAKKNIIEYFIIKVISSGVINDSFPKEIQDYLFTSDRQLDHIKFFDFVEKIAVLFDDYENDCFEISGWQKELYDCVMKECSNNNLATPAFLYYHKSGLKDIHKPLYFFGFLSFSKLQKKIIDEYASEHDVIVYSLIGEKRKIDYSLTAAPSKLREMEAVHSSICELLKDNENKYSDFLVVAKDMSEYENIIPRVFDQDNESFPAIPYAIRSFKKKNSDITIGLSQLLSILNKGFFTRLDFFEVGNNKTVQASRNFTGEQLNDWINALLAMNVYRNSDVIDDWDYAKKRLLTAKITNINNEENLLILGGKDYLPYSSISLDDSSVVSLIRMIDDLKSWLALKNKHSFISHDFLMDIKTELDKWFSFSDDGQETNNDYKKITRIIQKWDEYQIFFGNVPTEIFFYALIEGSKKVISYGGQLFTSGISFTDFDVSSALSAKYIFFLGLSSKNLPSQTIKDELDERTETIYKAEQEEKAFFALANNASHFYASYVNKNLKSDEDFYPSSFALKLEEMSQGKVKGETVISLDENRPWSDLYTKKEYKSKGYFDQLLKEDNIAVLPSEDDPVEANYLEKEKTGNIISFLMEPLQYKAKRLFGRFFDNFEEIQNEYEPFEMKNFDKNEIVAKLLEAKLNNENMDQETPFDSAFEDIENDLENHNSIPEFDETIKDCATEELKNEYDSVVEGLTELFDEDGMNNAKLIRTKDLTLNYEGHQFTLNSNRYAVCSVKDNVRSYGLIKEPKKTKTTSERVKPFIGAYLLALVDVASLEDDTEYEIKLYSQNTAQAPAVCRLNRTAAREYLNRIYEAMNDYNSSYFFPVSFLNEKKEKIERLKFRLIYKKNDTEWKFFDDKKMFNIDTQIGYNPYEPLFPQIEAFRKIVESLFAFKDQCPKEDGEKENGK